jgi:hypothetical protein
LSSRQPVPKNSSSVSCVARPQSRHRPATGSGRYRELCTRGAHKTDATRLENEMTILDCVEVWLHSLRGVFESAGTVVHFKRTHDDRPKQSCALILRQHLVEVDFIVWDSGEAELAVEQNAGVVTQEHFQGLGDPQALSAVLARLMTIIRVTNP